MSRAQRTDAERTWPRCPCCRTRRRTAAQLLAHMAEQRHVPCTCGGYHYSHRPYSPLCDLRPESGVLRAVGLTDDEVYEALIETTFVTRGRPLLRWPE